MSGAAVAGIAVEALTLTLGAFRLDAVDFALSAGEILVVLGPNGAGKSVTLETIAGFHRPERGRVRIGGRDVTTLAPEARHIGFVVQNFGLFPHLTVEGNVAIARRRAAHFKDAFKDAALPGAGDIAALLDYFGVAPLARRLPADLSPGEKQRVALARALVGAPELFLFDEPFSALDTQTRTQLRGELKLFLRALAIPAIFVTHDHDDALSLGDKVAVLRGGAIVQYGPAQDIFRAPADAFVARFVGVDNVLDGRIVASAAGTATVHVGKTTVRATLPPHPVAPGEAVKLAIRAEEVAIAPPADTPGDNRLDGIVTGLQEQGPLVAVAIDCGFLLKAYVLAPQARGLGLRIGGAVTAAIAPEAVHLMSA
jgi:ABC-type Fe3+/spermidine/putrescine transport system ATPase subunit